MSASQSEKSKAVVLHIHAQGRTICESHTHAGIYVQEKRGMHSPSYGHDGDIATSAVEFVEDNARV